MYEKLTETVKKYIEERKDSLLPIDYSDFDIFGKDVARIRGLADVFTDLAYSYDGDGTEKNRSIGIESLYGFASILELMADDIERKFEVFFENFRIVPKEETKKAQ